MLFRLTIPPGFEDLSATEFASLFAERLAAREAQLRAEHKRAGRSFLGAHAVKRQDPFSRPKTEEPIGGLNPHIKARNREQRIAEIRDLQRFRTEHEGARQRFIHGDRQAIFPAGTWFFRVFIGARCHPPP